jgi:hypothetical protein
MGLIPRSLLRLFVEGNAPSLLVRGTGVWATRPRRTDVDANEGESPSLLKTAFPEDGHSCPFILSVEFVMSGTGVSHLLAFEQSHDWLESIDGFRCPVANVVWVFDSKCNGRSLKGSHRL